jgi:hypothetical protein
MILAADENDFGVRTYFALKVLSERHTAESASDDNYPSFTHDSTSTPFLLISISDAVGKSGVPSGGTMATVSDHSFESRKGTPPS